MKLEEKLDIILSPPISEGVVDKAVAYILSLVSQARSHISLGRLIIKVSEALRAPIRDVVNRIAWTYAKWWYKGLEAVPTTVNISSQEEMSAYLSDEEFNELQDKLSAEIGDDMLRLIGVKSRDGTREREERKGEYRYITVLLPNGARTTKRVPIEWLPDELRYLDRVEIDEQDWVQIRIEAETKKKEEEAAKQAEEKKWRVKKREEKGLEQQKAEAGRAAYSRQSRELRVPSSRPAVPMESKIKSEYIFHYDLDE